MKKNLLSDNDKNADKKSKKSTLSNKWSWEAIIITSIYCFFGVLWISLSDLILEALTKDAEVYMTLQTFKGWFYVFVTTIMLYILINKRILMIKEENKKSIKTYEELRTAHTELEKIETELIYQKSLTDNIIHEAPVIIVTHNEMGDILSTNPFAQKIFGYSEDEMMGKDWFNLMKPEGLEGDIQGIFKKMKLEKQFKNYECPISTIDGRRINILWNSSILNRNDENQDSRFVSIGTDIEERKRFEEKVKYLAFYDALTGLPNRAMFENEINKFLALKSDNNFSIAYIDIDNFKNINDSMGHQVGDIFLKYLADCLKAEVEEPNLVARLGGDEFAILYFEISKEHLLENIEIIRKRISRTWSIQNRQFYITMSVGVVVFPTDGDSSTELLKNADIAMYAAKREGRNRILFYKEDIRDNNSWHVTMINNLQYGIEEEQFTLFYQPQFKLGTGEITGMEALVRWVHPEVGFISPAEFIPLAEETGQIYSLERWIITKALEQKKLWEEQGFKNLILSINLSGKTLTSDINFHELEYILSQVSIDFTKIVIEITETASISDVDIVIEHLDILKKLGLRVALDDFGTGYSSLNYLKKFPIDIIKLDKSFINSISEGGIDTLLIKNIIYLAHDLEFEVVAEGIETQEQLDYLKNYYCESGQGYLLSRPLPVDKIRDLLINTFIDLN